MLGLDLLAVARAQSEDEAPAERWSSVAAAMAMVGAVLTNTLLMLVPRRMRVVTAAAAPSTANWSPAWPSAIHADS